ncbi:MAG TPA: NUDIX domain-containing protein, partial [Burkholderiaceae bacterium]|nr:NUDIX domain-containing protein [Burkholderiaceae bacterium]
MTGAALDAAVWHALKARADAPPACPRDALWLAQAQIGSVEPALAAAMVAADLPVARTGAGWRIAAEPDADAALARIAHWLHCQGLGSAWRDERLAVTDAAGTPRARIERAAVRPLGIATRAVHLVGLGGEGGVWVQQRAFDKATDPGLWDTLMGGLQAAGESDAQTLERETWEEAGLRVAELIELRGAGHLIVRRPVADGYMVEHIEIVVATVPDNLVPTNRDGEVARFECLARPALRQ